MLTEFLISKIKDAFNEANTVAFGRHNDLRVMVNTNGRIFIHLDVYRFKDFEYRENTYYVKGQLSQFLDFLSFKTFTHVFALKLFTLFNTSLSTEHIPNIQYFIELVYRMQDPNNYRTCMETKINEGAGVCVMEYMINLNEKDVFLRE